MTTVNAINAVNTGNAVNSVNKERVLIHQIKSIYMCIFTGAEAAFWRILTSFQEQGVYGDLTTTYVNNSASLQHSHNQCTVSQMQPKLFWLGIKTAWEVMQAPTWDEKVILRKKNVPCLAFWFFGWSWWWEWPPKFSKSGHWGILRKCPFYM